MEPKVNRRRGVYRLAKEDPASADKQQDSRASDPAPFEDQILKEMQRGMITLTVLNPTRKTLHLPEEVTITNHKPG